jgi:MoxR-like ATPase
VPTACIASLPKPNLIASPLSGRQRCQGDRSMNYPGTVQELTETLRRGNYLADRGLATAVFVAMSLQRPILLEGEVGVGKTELAKVLASVFGRTLIRLQCYEGIDTNQALYEWDYARQLLYIRALSEQDIGGEEAIEKLFGPRFLLERPLMQAVQAGDQAVLLIDEVDRADDEFEAFLLEVLSDFQISIPEVGTIKAENPPLVILTSNRTRDLHDALKRRCMYHWIGYPDPQREVDIVTVQAPEVSATLAHKVVGAVNRLRQMDLAKPPGVAETIDWARTLSFLGEPELNASNADVTLGSIIKDRDDLELVRDNLHEVTSGSR